MSRERGIYAIRHVNGGLYVGSSVDLHSRRASHFSALANQKHSVPAMQSDYTTPGCMTFEVLQYIPTDQSLLVHEGRWLRALSPTATKIYNQDLSLLEHADKDPTVKPLSFAYALREIMDGEGITRSQLHKTTGIAYSTLNEHYYSQISRVDLKTLGILLAGLKILTGRAISLSELFPRIPTPMEATQ